MSAPSRCCRRFPAYGRANPKVLILQYLENGNTYNAFNLLWDFNIYQTLGDQLHRPGPAHRLVRVPVRPQYHQGDFGDTAAGYSNYMCSTGGSAAMYYGGTNPSLYPFDETNTIFLGLFNVQINESAPQPTVPTPPPSQNNYPYLAVTSKITMASIVDGTSNTGMFAETTMSPYAATIYPAIYAGQAHPIHRSWSMRGAEPGVTRFTRRVRQLGRAPASGF